MSVAPCPCFVSLRARALLTVLLALLLPLASAHAQLSAGEASKNLKPRAKAAEKAARIQMKAGEASFRLKLRAFELDMLSGALTEDALIDELAIDLADLQDAVHSAASTARDDVVADATGLLDQLDNEEALPHGFAPGDGGALDELREDLLRFAEKQRRRLLKRLGKTRKLINKKTGLRLAFILRPLDQVVAKVPGVGEDIAVAGPSHRIHWLMGASRAAEGGRVLAGGDQDPEAAAPTLLLTGDSGDASFELSAPESGRWLLSAGADEPLPRGNFLLQLAPGEDTPGVSAGIGLR
ncbi:MAG: hypothetical protein DHS20C15_04690 [Planctomycetota bacterium]|nr:MAG: hypothetical protein DHS20C15_04690 [Planctomycetota bacterium]